MTSSPVVTARGLHAEARRAARVAAFGATTVSMLGALKLHLRRLTADPVAQAQVQEAYVRRWAKTLLSIFDVRVHRVGEEALPTGAGVLVVANHRSTIDIGVMLALFGGQLVSRHDLAEWPLLGAAARTVGTIFVDRDSMTSGAGAIRTMTRCLEAGAVVGVFPEGTTFPGDEVRPFHRGAFVAARGAGALVVPVGIAYGGDDTAFVNESFGAHLARLAKRPTTFVSVAVGGALPVERNAERTAAAARARVSELVAVARADCRAREAGAA